MLSVKNAFEDVAEIAHQINKAICEAFGDDSQPDWEDAPDWQRKSAVNGVKFHLENPDVTPEDSHNNWLAEKLDDGWEFGLVKDAEKKRHPCICAFSDLPAEQRVKDFVFGQLVSEIKSLSNRQIERMSPEAFEAIKKELLG